MWCKCCGVYFRNPQSQCLHPFSLFFPPPFKEASPICHDEEFIPLLRFLFQLLQHPSLKTASINAQAKTNKQTNKPPKLNCSFFHKIISGLPALILPCALSHMCLYSCSCLYLKWSPLVLCHQQFFHSFSPVVFE